MLSDLSSPLPLFLLEDRVVLPGLVVPVAVTAGCLTELSGLGLCTGYLLVFACPPPEGNPAAEKSLCSTAGVLGRVVRFIRLGDSGGRLLVQGERRVCLDSIHTRGRLTLCRANEVRLPEPDEVHVEQVRRHLLTILNDRVRSDPSLSRELGEAAGLFRCPGQLADFIASNLPLSIQDKRALVDVFDPVQRAGLLISMVSEAPSIPRTERDSLDYQDFRPGEDYGEDLGEVRGEDPTVPDELESLASRIEQAGMPEEALEAARRELSRLRRLPASSAEHHTSRSWLECLADLPWSLAGQPKEDISLVREALDRDHHGLEEVKQRIVEYLAVRNLRGDTRGPVLCFAGPPGVGKTSLGQSIARALGRRFCRIPLGGVRDEAEIRGHRRTYVGSMPGRLIQSIRRAGTRDPVIMLDELDKLGGEARPDPASALLEALDPSQNHAFIDHYLEVGFDLSRVFFITTANIAWQIPEALRDRLEVIELPGYTPGEKLDICRRHILPRQLRENGLREDSLRIDNRALNEIIDCYTREAGVRQLEREIASLCRKCALQAIRGGEYPEILVERLPALLGPPSYPRESAGRDDEVGVSTALAWTSAGGEILLIEALRMGGGRGFELTGQLGEVMRESALAAQSWLRANCAQLDVQGDFFADWDIHLHVPSGATPKDGPSAGLAITAALASLMTGRAVRSDTAMTGEITLRGKILPVGGVREKVIAAHRAGIARVLLPAANRADLARLSREVSEGVSLILVDSLDEALTEVLLPPGHPD